MKILSTSFLTGFVLFSLGLTLSNNAESYDFNLGPGHEEVCDYSTHGVLFDTLKTFKGDCPMARIEMMPEFEASSQGQDGQSSATANVHWKHDLNCLDPVLIRWQKR